MTGVGKRYLFDFIDLLESVSLHVDQTCAARARSAQLLAKQGASRGSFAGELRGGSELRGGASRGSFAGELRGGASRGSFAGELRGGASRPGELRGRGSFAGELRGGASGASRGSFAGELRGGASRGSFAGELRGGASRGSFAGELRGGASRGIRSSARSARLIHSLCTRFSGFSTISFGLNS